MGSVVMENCTADVDGAQDAKGSRSAENFQKFMYELFEKNGVMNDLRSYLRGHIVNVLRSAQTGHPPSCQKHFTQRLELTFQALNILIAEYLLRLEFSYTLSVFVSEIPLANMVFSFAKTLMKQVDNDDSRPKFKDSDVWCILNYLGVKCDSDHATSIVEMYRLERNSPLLLCILKSVTLFKEPIVLEPMNTSQESLSSSVKSSESAEEKPRSPQRKASFQEKCRHYAFCKTCQSKMMRIKEKYRKKKKDIAKMFEQLKSVYEAEMELMKDEEDKRVKRSLATHSTQLRKRRDEMEESFKAREAELESNVQQKKRFLWGLARALRDQHQHMTRAMHDVRAETGRLSAKEASLKSELAEAEQILRQRGEDMRQQISAELAVLETHLHAMKQERDNINRERQQLQLYKDRSTHKSIEKEDLKPHYDLLRNELTILKKYIETAKLEPKCVMERSTLTDLHDVTSRIDAVLNNEQEVERRSDEGRVKPKQLVNDLKKPKNVNFSQWNLDEMYREKSRSRSRSSASSEAGDALYQTEQDSMQRLTDENEQLRCFSRQQREHIDSLLSQQARLEAELTALRVRAPSPLAPVTARAAPRPAPRPRTAPALAPAPALLALDAHAQRMSASASVNNLSYGWRKGAGEELSLFANAQPRIVVPGEAIPFVGVVTRHTDNRRYLINQWRSLRRRISPLCGGGGGGGVSKIRASSPIQRNLRDRPETAGPSVRLHLDQVENESANLSHPNSEAGYRPGEYHQPTSVTGDRRADGKTREKSPKSVLREAKEKLRNKDTVKDFAPTVREKSPNCVLREAKLRLRKLEIEAEAVEKSYLDFRRKQESFRDKRRNSRSGERTDSVANINAKDLNTKPNTSTYKLDETYNESTSHYHEPRPTNDYDRYFKEYQTKFDLGEHFKNKNTTAFRLNPIPDAYSIQEDKKPRNYIETPLTEFRKFYHSERFSSSRPKSPKPVSDSEKSTKGTRKEVIRQAKNDQVKELEILKHNIGKIYNMPEQAIVETPPTNEDSNNEIDEEWKENQQASAIEQNTIENDAVEVESKSIEDRNLLRIEVQNVSEINDVKVTESQSQDMLLIIESSVENNRDSEISESELNRDKFSTQMSIIVSPKISIPYNEGLAETLSPRNESRKSEITKSPRNLSVSESIKSSKIGSTKSSRKDIKSPKIGILDCGNSRRSGSEKSDKMKTDDVVAIYHDDNDNVSSVRMRLDLSKDVLDNTISELEQNEDPDYPDDFSADVDNYNSRSDYGNQSPISLPKTSEDENFWED